MEVYSVLLRLPGGLYTSWIDTRDVIHIVAILELKQGLDGSVLKLNTPMPWLPI